MDNKDSVYGYPFIFLSESSKAIILISPENHVLVKLNGMHPNDVELVKEDYLDLDKVIGFDLEKATKTLDSLLGGLGEEVLSYTIYLNTNKISATYDSDFFSKSQMILRGDQMEEAIKCFSEIIKALSYL